MEAHVSEIDLSNNVISSVPTFMSQFTRISYLNLANNAISDLPNEFGLLNTLRELNIANNKYVISDLNVVNCETKILVSF